MTDNAKARKSGMITVVNEAPASDTMPEIPSGVVRVDYISALDGLADWALLSPPAKGRVWVVFLHGYGSKGDQLYTHADLRAKWLPSFLSAGLGVFSANLRDNAFMCPAAVEDLRALLQWVRERHDAEQFVFFSGSMGGSSNLIYATLHPEDCAAVAALGAVTDMAAHYRWDMRHASGIQRQIGESFVKTYGGTPEEQPALYRKHSPVFNADRLTMPLYLAHGEKDDLIPVEQMRALAAALSGKPNVTYVEIAGGDHDSPCFHPPAMEWLLERARALQ